jgi:O-antigen ligase
VPTRTAPPRTTRVADAAGDGIATALFLGLPVIAVAVVGTLRNGAFFTPDVVVLPALSLALLVFSPDAVRWALHNPVVVAAGAAAAAWWLVDAQLTGHGVASWRMVAFAVCAVAGFGVVRQLPARSQAVVAASLFAVGVAVAVLGLAFVAAGSTAWTWPDERSLRFQGPLTYPSAIGVYLLVCLLASTQVPAGWIPARVVRSGQAVVLLGVVATDSRGALLALVVMLALRPPGIGTVVIAAVVGAPLLLYGQRDGVRPWFIAAAFAVTTVVASAGGNGTAFARRRAVAIGGAVVAAGGLAVAVVLLATQHHAVSGLDASWTQRRDIIHGAFRLFTKHWLLGSGPDPTIPTTMLDGAPGIDAFAHDEVVEILLSIGVLGFAGVVAAVVLVVRAIRQSRGAVAVPAVAAVLAAGLVDFDWHFPALGLVFGMACALGRPPEPRRIATGGRPKVSASPDRVASGP